jgi:hypothetical protein
MVFVYITAAIVSVLGAGAGGMRRGWGGGGWGGIYHIHLVSWRVAYHTKNDGYNTRLDDVPQWTRSTRSVTDAHHACFEAVDHTKTEWYGLKKGMNGTGPRSLSSHSSVNDFIIPVFKSWSWRTQTKNTGASDYSLAVPMGSGHGHTWANAYLQKVNPILSKPRSMAQLLQGQQRPRQA